MFVPKLLVALAVVFLASAEEWHAPADEWRTAIKEKVPLRFAELRAGQFDSKSQAWSHSRELFEAVHGGKSEFAVSESVTKEDAANSWDFSDFESLQSKAIYDTKSTYELLPGTTVHSLDLPKHDSLVQELGSDHVKHCMADSAIKADDIIIGSNNGAWFKTNAVKSAPANSLFVERDDHSMVLARRVLSVENLEGGCKRINTEHLHYLELFNNVKIESKGHRPFHDVPATPENLALAASTAERVKAATNADGSRRRLPVVNPDAPLVACSSFKTPVGTQYAGPGGQNGIQYSIGSAAGCVQYNYDVGSVSMNYNWNTRSAMIYNYNIGPGLSCTNCYVYSGAGFMAVAQYSTRNYFYMEVKIGGGAGAMVNLQANNPSIKGSLGPFTVQNAGSPSTFPIGGGLTVSLNSQGLRVDVSGSGGVNGGGAIAGGAEAYASLGLMYAQGKSSWPVTAFQQYKRPTCNMKFTSLQPFNALVMVTGGIGVTLALGGAVGSVNGHVHVTVGANVDWKSKTFQLTAKVDSEKASRALLKGSAAAPNAPTYYPGSTVPVTIEYDGYYPDEEHIAYYSIVTPSGEEHKVMHKAFTTSSSGKGSFTANWQVPTNDDFVGSNGWSHMRVRTSNRYQRHVDTAPFALRPRPGGFLHFDQSNVPAGRPFTVTWEPAAMNHYRMPPMSPIKGVEHSCNRVRFELIRHRLDDEGNSVESSSWREFGEPSDNTGAASVTVPTEATSGWHAFQLRAHADENDRVAGSGDGYFTFIHQRTDPVATRRQRVAAVRAIKDSRAVITAPPPAVVAAADIETQRALAAACNGIGVGVMASLQGAIDSMKILLWTVPLGYATQQVPLFPMQYLCF
jgi:hypothetical protein